jgi:hypothetical protein
MAQINFPNWMWWLIGAMIVVILCVVCKLNFNVGYEGIHFTQGLVK